MKVSTPFEFLVIALLTGVTVIQFFIAILLSKIFTIMVAG